MIRRRLRPALLFLLLGCGSGSSGGDWACNWTCTSSGTSGSHVYPDEGNPTSRCTTDYGSNCSNFNCSCTQN